MNRTRLIIFALVALLHVALLLFAAVRLEPAARQSPPSPAVIRLVDVREEVPPSLPPLEREAEPPHAAAVENISGIINSPVTEIDADPVDNSSHSGITETAGQETQTPATAGSGTTRPVISAPVFPEAQIRSALADNYPRMARLSNIEGTVYLELFIDREGIIQEVRVLGENPPNRSFGNAAVNALKGIRVQPAAADGVPVPIRYEYQISFTLR